ncbi:MAG: sigma-54-dependent Fis family transcriptional regulator [candidate division KSB1 bacterium]|nr:sigma-54-dependent Fis family transcriptional regulator [candidate division KSB1 bacterium]
MNTLSETSDSNLPIDDVNAQFAILKAANRIAHLLSKTIPLEQAIEPLISEFMDLVQAECGSIQLLRPGSQETQRTLIRKCTHGECGFDTTLENLVTGWILKHRTLLITDDIAAHIKLGAAAKRYAEISSFIAVPVSHQDHIIGVVSLIRVRPTPSFSEQNAKLAAALAQEVAEFIEQAHLREQLFSDYQKLKQEVTDRYSLHGILGNSPAMKEVFSLLDRVIPTEGRVLLQGESGTGKERIAKVIHHEGPRKNRPFIAVDCGALPPNLLESELFGHVKGSFTGADRDRRGLFEEANGGTLFLDEIANTTLETQSKLLRVLQEGEVRPIGSNKSRKVDVRIITAASIDLDQKIKKGEFRSDLFYRLNVVPIKLPSLRERVEDIPMLADHFLKRFAEKHGKQLRYIAPETIKIFENYSWPGNVRELENTIERGVILARPNDTTLKPEHLPFELSFSDLQQKPSELPLTGDLEALLANYEREILKTALSRHNWNQTAAAKELHISERTMRYKIQRLALLSPKK